MHKYCSQHDLTKEPRMQRLKQWLDDRIVFTPQDKAAQTCILVCKKYYLLQIIQHLEQSSCFTKTNESKKDVHKQFMNSLSNPRNSFDYLLTLDPLVKSSQEQKWKMPKMYAMPKRHKNPVRFRFISASTKAPTRCTSKILTSVLTLIDNTTKEEAQKYAIDSNGRNWYWIIKETSELLEYVKKNEIHSMQTYDFTTLYDTIPHSKLFSVMDKVIRNAFKVRKAKYVYIGKQLDGTLGAAWRKFTTHYSSCDCQTLTPDDILRLLQLLVENTFVCVGESLVFRQTIGIPMGTNAAPLIANLFLHFFEKEYFKKLLSGRASDFNSLSLSARFIDDLIVFNGRSPQEMDAIVNEIYNIEAPSAASSSSCSGLAVSRSNNDPQHASFLDLELRTQPNGQVSYRLYDKRRAFNFLWISYPHLDGLYPMKPMYGVFYGQLQRRLKLCKDFETFMDEAKILCKKLVKENAFEQSRLYHLFRKFVANYTRRDVDRCLQDFKRRCFHHQPVPLKR